MIETTLMVMEPAYRTYKELKSDSSPDNRINERPGSGTGERPDNRAGKRPGSEKSGSGTGSKKSEKPGSKISKKGKNPDVKKGKRPGSEITQRSESGADGRPGSEKGNKKSNISGKSDEKAGDKAGDMAKTMTDNKDPNQRRLLLMHWIVYATFHFADCLTRPWLPLFSFISIAAIVWLRAGGTEIIYRNIVEPYFIENESRIDKWMDDFHQLKNTVVNSAGVLHHAIVKTNSKTDATKSQHPPPHDITKNPKSPVVKPK